MKISLTLGGIDFLAQCMDGGPSPVFSKITYGNGEDAGKNATQLSNPLVEVGISNCEVKGKFIELTTVLNNSSLSFKDADIAKGFRATELGVFVTDPYNEGEVILFAYGYDEPEDATYIPAVTNHAFETTEVIMVYIGDTENVSAILSSSMTFVTKDYFENHTQDKNNPHKVDKTQVGLGLVPNCTTNDQIPTFDDAEKDEELISGVDNLGRLFGKLSKIVKSFISHKDDTRNPHNLTADIIGAAKRFHEHAAKDITKGVLSVERGGTGVGTYGRLITKIGPFISSYKGNANRIKTGGNQFINLGFTPCAVIVSCATGSMSYMTGEGTRGGMALVGHNLITEKLYSDFVLESNQNKAYERCMKEWDNKYVAMQIEKNGFRVNTTGTPGWCELNNENETYYFIAFRQGE